MEKIYCKLCGKQVNWGVDEYEQVPNEVYYPSAVRIEYESYPEVGVVFGDFVCHKPPEDNCFHKVILPIMIERHRSLGG